jgi:hypothetical protein
MAKYRVTVSDIACCNARIASDCTFAEAAEDVIEAALGERQFFGDALLGPDIVQTAFARAVRDNLEHLRREIASDDLTDVRCHVEADVSGAATEIEHAGFAVPPHQVGKRLQIGALRMHGAAEIGRGAGAELAADQRFLGFGLLGVDFFGFGLVRLCHDLDLKTWTSKTRCRTGHAQAIALKILV